MGETAKCYRCHFFPLKWVWQCKYVDVVIWWENFKKWVLGLWWWYSNAYCNCKEEWPIRHCEGPSRKRSGQFHPNQCWRFQCSTLGSHEQFEIVSYGGGGVIIIIYSVHYLFKNLINSSKSFRVVEYFTYMSVTVYPADMQCIFLF